jgi:hypothetical protein
VKVLAITGWCRNGSTIIGNVLGEVPGVTHVGELHFLWKNGSGRGVNRLCGCGLALDACGVWGPVLRAGVPDGVPLDGFAAEVMRRQRSAVRTRHTWRVMRHGTDRPDARAHADLMAATFREIAARTGSGLIVDTTKIPGESALLPYTEGVEPFFVHLVRDPVAVAHSWRAPKDYVYAMSAAKSTAYWVGFNAAARALIRRHPERSMLLRYEDFTADPAGTVDALLRLCGLDPAANPVRGRTVDLRVNHTVTGNPDRFRTGTTVIRARDDGWRDGLPARARRAAMAVSWPQRLRYGYRYGRVEVEENVGSRA